MKDGMGEAIYEVGIGGSFATYSDYFQFKNSQTKVANLFMSEVIDS